MASRWTGAGPEYRLDWGGRPWRLAVDSDRPGLVGPDVGPGPILAIDGISAEGRAEPCPIGGTCLVLHEIHLDRVEATYAPPDWGSLRLRASWAARGDDEVDLEIQIQAHSVGELLGVRVRVVSLLDVMAGPEAGGDPAAEVWTDGPRSYLEMVHPGDRPAGPASAVGRPSSIRHDLFGYDLERGVIIRGRLRAAWLADPAPAEVSRRIARFAAEPPPLGP